MSHFLRRPLLDRRNQSSVVSATYIGNAGTNTDLTTYDVLTIVPTTFLAEAADRYLVASVGDGTTSAPNSAIVRVEVNGVTATKLVEILPGALIISDALFVVPMPVGNIFSFYIQHGETQTALNVAAWAVYGIDPRATDTDSVEGTTVTSIAISGLTVPTAGIGLAACFLNNNNTVSWTGVTEDFDVTQTGRHSGGQTIIVGTNTITATFASTNGVLVGAAFSASGV